MTVEIYCDTVLSSLWVNMLEKVNYDRNRRIQNLHNQMYRLLDIRHLSRRTLLRKVTRRCQAKDR